ncbi:adenosylcobinamide hydrolase [Methanolinea mesophila]|uniref:adenosylcobinamide amidohydrolase n=1 Tax=Methanolinea mesophila TaxID=547055 RepID=UPI001AEA10D4|nr:adenosylcobinamide amidohydrolase [Methanolinea mesophila]MBP1928679.1 adenosylcobinamide hydrolase [Methanolinea mesophila]
MRYYLRDGSLFIRGRFLAASTGIQGGVRRVSTILSHTVRPDWDGKEPERELSLQVARAGLPPDYFGLLTAVPMRNLCVLSYGTLTVFITAGVSNPDPEFHPEICPDERAHTINIILHSGEGMSEGALLECIITATGAKAAALHSLGYPFSGTTTDAVIVACEGENVHRYAGTGTELGKRIARAVLHGVPEALKRQQGEISRDRPSFFIFSRYGGEHWVEWVPEDCPYYPCHFPGQRCDFCYCPFYPCRDEGLGQWMESSSGGKVWNCSRCTLVHEPEVTEYLRAHPEASLAELRAVEKRLKKPRES